MTTSTQATLLRRMIRPQGDEVAKNPLTSSRAVRLALTKSANDSIGLVLTVTSVAEAEGALDETLATLSDDLLLVGLHREDALVGLAVLDQELRAAVVEVQTVGALIAQKAAERAPTNTDAFLSLPILQGFLAAFPDAVRGTSLDGWGDDAQPDARIADLRTAGLLLQDGRYRSVQMSVDLGVAERQGVLQIILPVTDAPAMPGVVKSAPADWHADFQENVLDAATGMDAVLHRFTVPLATMRGLAVGDIMPLPGCTVSSVNLVSADGASVAQAKLGQMGGMRALRLQAAPAPEMTELPGGAPEVAADNLLPQVDMNAEIEMPLGNEISIDAAPLAEGDAAGMVET